MVLPINDRKWNRFDSMDIIANIYIWTTRSSRFTTNFYKCPGSIQSMVWCGVYNMTRSRRLQLQLNWLSISFLFPLISAQKYPFSNVDITFPHRVSSLPWHPRQHTPSQRRRYVSSRSSIFSYQSLSIDNRSDWSFNSSGLQISFSLSVFLKGRPLRHGWVCR